MPELRTPITEAEFKELNRWKKKLDKTTRAIMREALNDYFVKQRNLERGLDQVYAPARPYTQTKFKFE